MTDYVIKKISKISNPYQGEFGEYKFVTLKLEEKDNPATLSGDYIYASLILNENESLIPELKTINEKDFIINTKLIESISTDGTGEKFTNFQFDKETSKKLKWNNFYKEVEKLF